MLLKATVMMYQKTNDELVAVRTLCKVSRIWWHVIHNVRPAFQRRIDGETLSLLWFNQSVRLLRKSQMNFIKLLNNIYDICIQGSIISPWVEAMVSATNREETPSSALSVDPVIRTAGILA